ncbi:MAG: pyruvate:ferredoxin (flavodoxin) oxidoreductase, partial [Anaerolineales bacterium]
MGVERRTVTIDGNEAVARVAHRLNEVIAIYPITPSTPMGELADLWSSQGKTNLWGTVPLVAEMQAEGGAAGAVHGALQAGALTTTFTGSQGLLLMIPNMYKIAGELTAAVFHVAARSVAAQALSIFGDHSDVMAARQTGFAMLAAGSVQEAHDFAAIAQAATLRARVPFMHFFEGFRTSHEINKIEILADEVLRALIDDELVHAHRERALNPDRPVVRGTAQNPDVFFQARESVNRFYIACPGIVQEAMEQFGALTGRRYRLFEYSGAQDAERVVILMGSGAETAHATVDRLVAAGEAVGVLKVRLYRPFDARAFAAALPPTVRAVAVLDRTKEPGATGEPLYLDVVAALHEQWAASRGMPVVIGGRYGLSSKEFTPAMVKAVFDELGRPHPKNHFTVGITDDVTHTSLPFDPEWSIESSGTVRAVFYGLGSDGTVSANKNSIKIIGEETPNYAQGYFVYDSKKAGSQTVSHLRFGPEPIRAPYLVQSANFIGCHQFSFLERFDPLRPAAPGSILLINTPYTNHETWEHLPRHVQETIIEKHLRVFAINAYKVAQHTGMGRRINTIMQTCFFALMDKAADVRLLNTDDAIAAIKIAIKKTYGKAGAQAVLRNYDAIGQALDYLREVEAPPEATSEIKRRPPVSDLAPEFVRAITARMLDGQGDQLPVSALPFDGTYPTGTARWEKRAIATEIPVWDEELCIQCGKCVLICPHAVVRMKVYDPELAEGAPPGFKSVAARFREYRDQAYTLQVAPEDCTGCGLCVEVCPVKNKRAVRLKAINMHPLHGDGADGSLLEQEKANWEFFLNLPAADMGAERLNQVKYSQLRRPLFEFSGACAGCGETPYLKLLSQLFGDRAIIANATGCSSIYGGNLPTTPWASNSEGRGPAWSNSLFEDNAEFGFGMRLALDQRLAEATELLRGLRAELGAELADAVLNADQTDATGIGAQRQR